jgi:hypothetical protein
MVLAGGSLSILRRKNFLTYGGSIENLSVLLTNNIQSLLIEFQKEIY